MAYLLANSQLYCLLMLRNIEKLGHYLSKREVVVKVYMAGERFSRGNVDGRSGKVSHQIFRFRYASNRHPYLCCDVC